jgi:hypothetical protein
VRVPVFVIDDITGAVNVSVVPFVVAPEIPPNAPALLYCTCVVEPPGDPPAGVAHAPSPRQKVVAEAEVPLFRLVTGRLPVTPVVSGKPVKLVAVPLDGVPSAPLNNTTAPAEPVFTPRAVTTPIPVVVVAGAAPAPPPITNALAARAADVAQVDALEKYGTPPLVPATVSAKVPLVVIGEPDTEIKPPVKD